MHASELRRWDVQGARCIALSGIALNDRFGLVSSAAPFALSRISKELTVELFIGYGELWP